jgi:hypothetical protein
VAFGGRRMGRPTASRHQREVPGSASAYPRRNGLHRDHPSHALGNAERFSKSEGRQWFS